MARLFGWLSKAHAWLSWKGLETESWLTKVRASWHCPVRCYTALCYHGASSCLHERQDAAPWNNATIISLLLYGYVNRSYWSKKWVTRCRAKLNCPFCSGEHSLPFSFVSTFVLALVNGWSIPFFVYAVLQDLDPDCDSALYQFITSLELEATCTATGFHSKNVETAAHGNRNKGNNEQGKKTWWWFCACVIRFVFGTMNIQPAMVSVCVCWGARLFCVLGQFKAAEHCIMSLKCCASELSGNFAHDSQRRGRGIAWKHSTRRGTVGETEQVE